MSIYFEYIYIVNSVCICAYMCILYKNKHRLIKFALDLTYIMHFMQREMCVR